MVDLVGTDEIKEDSRVASQVIQAGDIGRVYGGVKVASNMTPAEAAELGGLNYTVSEKGACLASKNREPFVTVRGVKPRVLYREDTGAIFGSVMSRYQVIQNNVLVDLAEQIMASDEAACITAAGTLYQGLIAWMCLELASIDVIPGDGIKRHLVLFNSHEGKTNLMAHLIDHRLACQNEFVLTGGLHGSSIPFKIKHTSGAFDRLDTLGTFLANAREDFSDVADAYHLFADTPLKAEDRLPLIHKAIGVNPKELKNWQAGKAPRQHQWIRVSDTIEKAIATSPGAQYGEGTVWPAFNAMTYYFDHERTVRNSKAEGKTDLLIEDQILGHGVGKKRDAFKACLDYCRN